MSPINPLKLQDITGNDEDLEAIEEFYLQDIEKMMNQRLMEQINNLKSQLKFEISNQKYDSFTSSFQHNKGFESEKCKELKAKLKSKIYEFKTLSFSVLSQKNKDEIISMLGDSWSDYSNKKLVIRNPGEDKKAESVL